MNDATDALARALTNWAVPGQSEPAPVYRLVAVEVERALAALGYEVRPIIERNTWAVSAETRNREVEQAAEANPGTTSGASADRVGGQETPDALVGLPTTSAAADPLARAREGGGDFRLRQLLHDAHTRGYDLVPIEQAAEAADREAAGGSRDAAGNSSAAAEPRTATGRARQEYIEYILKANPTGWPLSVHENNLDAIEREAAEDEFERVVLRLRELHADPDLIGKLHILAEHDR